jgi:hypothetical protein
MPAPTETVVLLTTWNRPALLRQSLPQIEREARSIGARIVIADDQSADPETLALLEGAAGRGAELIRRPYVRERVSVDDCVHREPADALRTLLHSPIGAELVRGCALGGAPPDAPLGAANQLLGLYLRRAHVNAQLNNLFGFRHILDRHPSAGRILKVDDDVALAPGAFTAMATTWERAARDGHDVLAVAGIRTVHEPASASFDGYSITRGICNVAVLYRREDWLAMLELIPESRILSDGFDVAFAEGYAPLARPGAVAICVTPSVAYHTGRSGLHVRGEDVNTDFAGSLHDVTVQ